jgi:threonyl-tRNA synthetase
VLAKLKASGIRAVADLSGDKLGAKIRVARNMRIPYRAVVGEKEVESGGLSLSSRDENKDLGMMGLDEVIAKLTRESLPPSLRF